MRSKADFVWTYKEGASVADSCLVLYFLQHGRQDELKIGFSVSKKVGKAVTRNLVKRRLKSVFAELADRIEKGHNLVVIARPKAALSSSRDLSRSVERLLKKAGILMDFYENYS